MRLPRALAPLACVLALMLAPPARAQNDDAPPPPADLVVANAAIWTGDAANPLARALAVRDGLFLGVGSDDEIRPLIGPDTKTIDAGGARLIPGLIDAHVCLVDAAKSLQYLDASGATSRDTLFRLLRDRRKTHPDDQWIIAFGLDWESWSDPAPPTPAQIDRATDDHPTLLLRADGAALLASASALEAAKITRTPSPKPTYDAIIDRERDGTPTGLITADPMAIFDRVVPRQPARAIAALLEQAAQRANSFAITQVGAFDSSADLRDVVLALDERAKLTLRVGATIRERRKDAGQWKTTLDWIGRNRTPSPLVTVLGVGGDIDGTLATRTALLAAPYLDNPPADADDAGLYLPAASSNQLHEIVSQAASLGLQPALGASGDRAASVALEWFGEMLPTTRTSLRPRVEHVELLSTADVRRFAELSVVACVEPAQRARVAPKRLGAARALNCFPLRALLDAGATIAFASGSPAGPASPWLAIQAAISTDPPFDPQQSITLEQALHAYTTGAAFALHAEDTTGMIRVGYRADFAILNRDPLTTRVRDFPHIAAITTVLEGKVVYQAD